MRRMSVVFLSLLFTSFYLTTACSQREGDVMSKPIEGPVELATFAGGCFWCMEPPYEKLTGVYSAISGYAGGEEVNPVYEDVARGKTGHREAVQISYNPEQITYQQLLDVYWRQIDPTDAGGSFVDRGFQYSSAIYAHDDEQLALAQASKQALIESNQFDDPIATVVEPFTTFYPAEEYHQDYYKENTLRYKYYRSRSGRDDFIEENWQGVPATVTGGGNSKEGAYMKPDDATIKEMLTPLQYKVTQKDGTERPFDNEFWDNKEEGIYVDIVSGEPLFSSTHKYKSGTGWPSFTQPLEASHIVEKEDKSLFSTRIEVRSAHGDSHLGHVFPDGPQPTGLRYCINSASLKFIPKDKLADEGYEKYLPLFE